MTSPKPKTRRDFMPAPIRHLDGVLLRRYPLLWSSRLHFNIPIAMGLLILASTFGWALKTAQLPIQNSMTVGLLFVLPWFVIVFRQERTLPEAAARMPERRLEAYARLLLLLLWSSIVSYTPVAFAATVDSAQRSSALFVPMSAAVVWTAALMFMSPNLIWGLPMLLYIAILVLEVVGFLIGGAAYGAVYAWQAVVVRSSEAEPSITVVLLLGALGAGILLVLVRRRLSHAGAWRLIAVLAALVTPLAIVSVAAIVEDGNLNSMRSFFIALTAGELFVLLPALPVLRGQSRLALLTPEMPTIFKFVMRRGNR